MHADYIATVVAYRLLTSFQRKNWVMAEEAADELAELCAGDWHRCKSLIGNARSASHPRELISRANREARLACERTAF